MPGSLSRGLAGAKGQLGVSKQLVGYLHQYIEGTYDGLCRPCSMNVCFGTECKEESFVKQVLEIR